MGRWYSPNLPNTPPTKIPKAKGSPAEQKLPSKKEERGIVEMAVQKAKELWDWWESKGTITREKQPTVQKPEGRSPAIVKDVKKEDSKITNSCGGKFCIKKGDKNELIREINIRLSGFGGNVPTDEFTERTERMIKQFQRDYMKVPEMGKICGNVLRAIDEFCNKWTEKIITYKCLCHASNSKVKPKDRCLGYGKGKKNEHTGIHRTLL